MMHDQSGYTPPSVSSGQNPATLISNRWLEVVKEYTPVVARTLDHHGSKSIGAYLSTLVPQECNSYQSRADFINIYHAEVEELLGEEIACKAARELDDCPLVLTANHLGVDYFSQSVQSNLLFYLLKKQLTSSPSVVPVIACGSIPLDNITYPLGALIYEADNLSLDNIPKKIPLFTNKVRRRLVHVAPPLQPAMLERALKHVQQMLNSGEIGDKIAHALCTILRDDYQAPGIMKLGSYSQQSKMVNERIWQRLFRDPQTDSHLVTLDMERITSRLLTSDLLYPDSLISTVFFNPKLRDKLLNKLNGMRACWNLEQLGERLSASQAANSAKLLPAGGGTVFFWGIDERSRRIPLTLYHSSEGKVVLEGVDDRRKHYSVPFTIESILQELNKKALIPSIFTSFTILAFARGLTCLGGYYQGEYLPAIQQQLASLLGELPGYHKMARAISRVRTDGYLSGMQAIMKKSKFGLIPAGPIEIIASKGLQQKDLAQILRLTVHDAHMASLIETVYDVAPRERLQNGLRNALAQECFSLRNKLVVI